MAISTIVKNKRDGTLVLTDNAAAKSLTIAYEAGDFTLNVPGYSVSHYPDRGAIGSPPSIRHVDDQPMTGTFTAYMRDISDATYATLEEIILGPSGYVGSNWVSTMGANGEVFTVTATWTIEGTNHGDSADHTVACNYVYMTGSLSDGDPNMINITFTAYDLFPTVT